MNRLILMLVLLVAANAYGYEGALSAGSWALDTLRFADNNTSSTAYEATLLLDERHWDISVGRMAENTHFGVGTIDYLSIQRVVRFGEILPLDLFAGVGGMIRSNGDRVEELLPSELNFAISAGLDVGPLRVQLRHASNGGFKDPNRGVNWLLFGVTFGGAP